jgi:hypothetical protein
MERFFETPWETSERRSERHRAIESLEDLRFREPRVAVRLAILLGNGGAGQRTMFTKNISAAGAFITCDPAEVTEDEFLITISERGLFHSEARVLRREPDGVAVVFVQPPSTFVEALQRILVGSMNAANV